MVRPTTIDARGGGPESLEPARARPLPLRRPGLEGLLRRTADDQPDQTQHGTPEEGQPPSPAVHAVAGQLDGGQCGEAGHDVAGRRGHILEASEERAAPGPGGLDEEGDRGAVLTAEGEALDQPGRHQQRGCERARGSVTRGQRDHQATEAHEQDRHHERTAAAEPVGPGPHHGGADRAGGERDREDGEGVEQRHQRVIRRLGEDVVREVDGQKGVGVPVVRLDGVADSSAQQLAPGPCLRGRGGRIRVSHCHAWASPTPPASARTEVPWCARTGRSGRRAAPAGGSCRW